jgi:hypothetical protein
MVDLVFLHMFLGEPKRPNGCENAGKQRLSHQFRRQKRRAYLSPDLTKSVRMRGEFKVYSG